MLKQGGGLGRRNRRLLCATTAVVVTFAAGLAAAPAWAQDTGDSTLIDELVVTAEKRSENLQEVPVAISAFSGDRIAASGARSVADIQTLAAGVNFGVERAGVLRTSIRGISSNVGVETAVATHLDGVYLANRYDQTGAFFDIERIEVLRGPQGTLYGRNATGGAINILTRNPTREAEAGGQLTYGNYQLFETQGFAGGPLIGDGVRGRIAFKTTNLPGYGRNLYDGRHVNGYNTVSGRVKLDIDASEAVFVRLSADYARNQSTYADEITRLFPNLPLAPETRGFVFARGYDSARNRPNDQDITAYGASARVEWDLGFAKLTSLTGARRMIAEGAIDIDGTQNDWAAFNINRTRNEELTQEFNLASSGEGPLQWLVGAFYMDNELRGFRFVSTSPVGPNIIANLNYYTTKAYAVYGQASYQLTDALELTVGGRYSEEKNKDDEDRQLPPGAKTFLHQENKFDSFTPKVTLQWKAAEDINLYATYVKGFKSGGFNASNNDPSNFRPEKVTNYELGLKTLLFDRAVMLNVAAFYMDYNDLQVNTTILLPPGIPAIRVVNAAKARIKGVEADFRAVKGPFSFDGNFAYLDAQYRDFAAASDNIGATRFPLDVPLGARARSASGNRMVSAPKVSGNLGVQYAVDVTEAWSATVRGEYSYQSRIYYTPFEDLRGTSQKAAGVFNARVEFRNDADAWSVSVWGRNLSDERIISNQIEGNDGAATGTFHGTIYRPPRTYGVTIGKNF